MRGLFKSLTPSKPASTANIRYDSSDSPVINSASDYLAYQAKMNEIKASQPQVISNEYGSDFTISYKPNYCYAQAGSNNYGYVNVTSSCATFALATTLSIYKNELITLDIISTNSAADGHGTMWGYHNATRYNGTEEEVFEGIDRELSNGNPVVVGATGYNSKGVPSQHWATVIGKQDGQYIIIDPYFGSVCTLSEMQIYKNDGEIISYVTVS
jgi:hypothetical protein